jgi:hypothetical protein
MIALKGSHLLVHRWLEGGAAQGLLPQAVDARDETRASALSPARLAKDVFIIQHVIVIFI